MSQFDQRQYRLMLQTLECFEKGQIRLNALVDDLEGLLNVLEDSKEEWKQRFLQEWGKLEDERAYALFRNIKIFDEATTQRLREAVSHLKLMVLEQVDDPADHPSRMS